MPDSSRDSIYAVVYVFARDPGGGEHLEVIEKGTVLVLIGSRQPATNSLPGISSDVTVEAVTSERSLLLRMASIVTMKDPDILLSWDTHGAGIGYLVERGVALGKSASGSNENAASANEAGIDIARLLGRIPKASSGKDSRKTEAIVGLNIFDGADDKDGTQGAWTGSGLGSEWDDRVGAGAAASSIVSLSVLHYLRLVMYVVLSVAGEFICYLGRTDCNMWLEDLFRRMQTSQRIISTCDSLGCVE